jgi:PPOX class probable F420-dependent enzyme
MTLAFRPPPDYGSGGWGFESLAARQTLRSEAIKQEKLDEALLAMAVLPIPVVLSITLPEVSQAWVERLRPLLEAPSPAVLTTYRKDGSAHTVPVWFRWAGQAFEVVIARGDVKLRHLARDPRCVLVVFEAVRPFRGLEVRGVAELIEGDVTSARAVIAGRYLGVGDGERFAAERRSTPGVLLRLVPDSPRVWDLSGILPR